MRLTALPLVAGLLLLASAAGADGEGANRRPLEEKFVAAQAVEIPADVENDERPSAERQVYFGDLHIHSSWSIDAYGLGVRVGPEDAYHFAQGKSIPHIGGTPIQLAGPPLDFMALTDHAEYLGVIQAVSDSGHPLRAQPIIRQWLGEEQAVAQSAWRRIQRSFGRREAIPLLVTDTVVQPAWQELIALANRYNDPGRFTAFIGFEYSSNPASQNLHRNVIFRSAKVPGRPFSAMDSNNPEDLWRWMDEARSRGEDLLAIPHNSNGSNGLMFARTRFDGRPIDSEWAAQRARNEPIVEVMQIKGQSETHPILSPNDEWAAFELAPWRTLNPALPSQPSGSYVRDALRAGMRIQATLGVNPFAVGMIGSTDGHNASSPFEESNYTGKIGKLDGTPASRLAGSIPTQTSPQLMPNVGLYWGAAGLAGVWSNANTRADLFDALRRREAFSTSGPRIRVRFFAGWNFMAGDAESDIAKIGYAQGVPMGGVLSKRASTGAPSFLIAAAKDPLEANLERIQIIKGWTEGGTTREQVFDVACSSGDVPDPRRHRCPNRTRLPNLTTCDPDTHSGSKTFETWWRDPDFDPSEHAFYYVRVLQVPTCRWSTLDANRLGLEPTKLVPSLIRERAITSPIWYEPS